VNVRVRLYRFRARLAEKTAAVREWWFYHKPNSYAAALRWARFKHGLTLRLNAKRTHARLERERKKRVKRRMEFRERWRWEALYAEECLKREVCFARFLDAAARGLRRMLEVS